MPSAFRVLGYSLIIGLTMTIAAGWIGFLIFSPEGALFVIVMSCVAAATGNLSGGSLLFLMPPGFGAVYGSWLVTLVAFPCLAVLLRYRPLLLTVAAPLIGAGLGFLIVRYGLGETVGRFLLSGTFDLRSPVEIRSAGIVRLVAAGAFAGLVTGAVFGRTVSSYIRD